MLNDGTGSKERRHSGRWRQRRDLEWRLRRGRRAKLGLIVERSLNGLVLIVPATDAPAEGAYVLPATAQAGNRHGFREAIVRRSLNQGEQSVLFMEILA